ncbi:MAG: EAL domain-containing protein [Caulobacterales bacterium]|nr:EAL domain-containing protein [Caulobacterales bacterium]
MMQSTKHKVIDIRTHLLWHGGIEHALWSALNMLEATLCSLENNGVLHWHNHDNNIFAAENLPQNLNELGNEIGVQNLENRFFATPIHANSRKLILSNIGFSLVQDIKTGFLTIQKLYQSNNNDIENDLEAKELAEALNQDRIILYSQPIVCAKSFLPIRHECLARLTKNDGSIALPYEFIPAAERSGLIKELDVRTLELALRNIKNNQSFNLATNVSFATICDKAARDEIISILQHHQTIAQKLTIEITETIAIHDFDIAANFAIELKKIGTKLSLDDFGAGHTSFKSLRELKIDEVKIDGQYVRDVNERKDAFLFISAINAIAKELGIKSVAERVENTQERDTLLPLNIDAFQGYFFGKPRPIDI